MKRTASIAAIAFAVCVLAGSPARAVGATTVVLIDGTTVTGEIVAVEASVHLELRLPDGAIRVIPWARLRAGQAALQQGARVTAAIGPAAPASASTAWLEPSPGTVPVTFASLRFPLAIREADGPAVCVTPCTLYLPPRPIRWVAGGADYLDASFTLAAGHAPTRVWLRAVRRRQLAFGYVALIGAALTAVPAALTLGVGVASFFGTPATTVPAGLDHGSDGPMILALGGALTLGSTALLITGLLLIHPPPLGAIRVEPRPTLAFAPQRGGASVALSFRF